MNMNFYLGHQIIREFSPDQQWYIVPDQDLETPDHFLMQFLSGSKYEVPKNHG